MKVVVLIEPAVARERQDALLREQVIQLEFSDLEVEPSRIKNIAEADVGGFNVERPQFVRGWHEQEAEVLGQGSAGQNIQAGIVKARRLHIRNRAIFQRHMVICLQETVLRGSYSYTP